ncbi:hypothetical protein IB49_17825 [Geobacillus sp. LC300]|nr:hypothetical protein IB49_17825 [Geobacillus sp. LC300]
MIKSVLNRAHRAISTSKVFAHESLVEVESVSMRRYGRSSIVHKNPVALAIGRFRAAGANTASALKMGSRIRECRRCKGYFILFRAGDSHFNDQRE